MGNLAAHPSKFRAMFYSQRLLERPRNPDVRKLTSQASTAAETSYYTIAERLNGLDLTQQSRLRFENFSDADNKLMQ